MPLPTMLGNDIDVVEGFPTVDLQTGANNGDYIAVKNAATVVILFSSGVGTAGDDPTVTVQQATDNSGTSAKALNIVTSPVQIWKKQAATSQASTATWSDATDDVTANAATSATGAEQSQTYAIEFHPSDLDVDNGFDHLRATIADVGSNAQPGCLHYIVRPMYPSNPDNVLSHL